MCVCVCRSDLVFKKKKHEAREGFFSRAAALAHAHAVAELRGGVAEEARALTAQAAAVQAHRVAHDVRRARAGARAREDGAAAARN